ncbi:hypothetical protein MN116_008350 [Schistosoma mekongi]|uniref:Uncharacterized protein n=1 Tax=Schistosoma mekongi TaxID=38744 RepID=A0AAE2D2Q0_SCHME|nr:hypothetical protein MN116_008350 [Schistosoma mekongi]
MTIIIKTTVFFICLVLFSVQSDIGHGWNNQPPKLMKHLEPQDDKLNRKHQYDIDSVGAADNDDELFYLLNSNQQPDTFKSKLSSNPSAKDNLSIEADIDEDDDTLDKSNSYVNDNNEAFEYISPFWTNQIYYENPFKKRHVTITDDDSLSEKGQLDDNSIIVKKMPETEKWSTPIQPGNSKDLRKLRNLDGLNWYHFTVANQQQKQKHQDDVDSDNTHPVDSKSSTNESEFSQWG